MGCEAASRVARRADARLDDHVWCCGLTATRFENGKPDRAVIALTLDGDTMNMGQMLEFSQTIKHGTGKKAAQVP